MIYYILLRKGNTELVKIMIFRKQKIIISIFMLFI